MGKSYRKPYSAITGVKSAKHDKMVARRCWRRAQEQALRDCKDWEELVIPKRLEASFNEVYSWGRDGGQSYQSKPTLDRHWQWTFMTAEEWYERSMKYWLRLHRK